MEKRKTDRSIVSDIGLLPPSNVELEEAVLGAVLLEERAYHAISDILIPEIFYKEQNGIIAQAIIALRNRGEGSDILMVTQELKRMGKLELVGGSYYVSALTNRIASSANIEFHARIVLQDYIKRYAITEATALIKRAYDHASDCFDIIDQYEKNLTELTTQIFLSKSSDSTTLYNRVLEHNRKIVSAGNKTIGVPSGFDDIDKFMGGWQKSDMIILAARPGMGKTAQALQFARNAAMAGHPTGIFSLEMSELQLYQRLCSQETEIPLEMIAKRGMDPDTEKIFVRDMEKLKDAPLFIDDTGDLSIFEMRQKARKWKREENIELIILDYLQMMNGGSGSRGNREQEISTISRGIKALAKELNIPIIALSQLSRQSENRPGASKIPQLSDLRDSGAIEQDADVVMFIYRPEYYGLTQDAEGNSTKGYSQQIIAKNRSGATDEIDMRWQGNIVKFLNYNHRHESADTFSFLD